MHRIQLTHADGSVTFTRNQYDHQTADRLARACTQDPAITAAKAVPVAACDCRCAEEHEALCIRPYEAAA
jgi:hypothetical protein